MKFPEEIDHQVDFLRFCRSFFPYLSPSLAGDTKFPTAPYYWNEGTRIVFEFSSPLTTDFISHFNDLGHWINQNFILRLFAVLESNGFISENISLRTALEGHAEMDLLRRLRQKFAHGSGQYDPADNEKKRLYDRLVGHFNLNPAEYPETAGKYPIPIDQVLIPIAERCRRYGLAVQQSPAGYQTQVPD